MISSQDIQSVTFEKSLRGYRTDEVDEYLAKLAQEFETNAKEKADMEKKLYILAEKVDQYRNDEETLKTALLNAQRLGETVVYEAKQKAETIIYDANSKASQAKEEAADKVAAEELTLAQLQSSVARFKNDVLDLYRQHIESLSAIPGAVDRKTTRQAQTAAPQPETASSTSPAPEADSLHTEKSQPATENLFSFHDASVPVSAAKDATPMFDNYQGIRFDD
ncbi:MAG: DivIVA domain-containing protein [Ruthenibacterium sp.]